MAIIYIVYEKRKDETSIDFPSLPYDLHIPLMKMVEPIKLREIECVNFTKLWISIMDDLHEEEDIYNQINKFLQNMKTWLTSSSLCACKSIKLVDDRCTYYVLGFSDDWNSEEVFQLYFMDHQRDEIRIEYYETEHCNTINYMVDVSTFSSPDEWNCALALLGGYVDKMMKESESDKVLDEVMALERHYALSIPYIIMFYLHGPFFHLHDMMFRESGDRFH